MSEYMDLSLERFFYYWEGGELFEEAPPFLIGKHRNHI